MKILIVDDELLVREGIKAMVDWQEHGHEIVGEAADGDEAKKLVEALKPDIVLTDLTMSPCDGFELIEYITQKNKQIGIVVLSCHNDFDHVRKAMKLGAMDYLFKLTMTEDEILKTIHEVIKHLSKHQPYPSVLPPSNRAVLINHLVKEILNGDQYDINRCAGEFKRLKMKCQFEKKYQMIIFRINGFHKIRLNDRSRISNNIQFVLENFLQDVFEQYSDFEIFALSDREIGLVINYKSRTYKAAFDELNKQLIMIYGFDMSIFVSGLHQSLEGLKGAYQDCMTLKRLRFFRGKGIYNGLSEQIKLSRGLDKKSFDIRDLSLNPTSDYLDAMFISMSEMLTEQACKLTCVHYGKYLMYSHHSESFDRENQQMLEELLLYMKSADDINYLRDLLNELIRIIRNNENHQQVRKEIILAKHYVHEHMSTEIALADVAKHVHMSESYFSHLFKKETGISFKTFVNEEKIKKAKLLLEDPHIRVYEVGASVGITNSNYFSILFKKVVGLSPSDYIESKKSKGTFKKNETQKE